MKLSEITLLHKEMANVIAENRNRQKKIFEIEATLTKRNTFLESENDCLMLGLAVSHRRVEAYENSDSPPSWHKKRWA